VFSRRSQINRTTSKCLSFQPQPSSQPPQSVHSHPLHRMPAPPFCYTQYKPILHRDILPTNTRPQPLLPAAHRPDPRSSVNLPWPHNPLVQVAWMVGFDWNYTLCWEISIIVFPSEATQIFERALDVREGYLLPFFLIRCEKATYHVCHEIPSTSVTTHFVVCGSCNYCELAFEDVQSIRERL